MHIFSKTSIIIILISLTVWPHFIYAENNADFVVVRKGERKMSLLSNGSIIKTYIISLGRNPKGHKTKRGDSRTPEGRYIIDYRNPNSSYHLSLHISYPNARDRKQAKQNGVDPGGMIMIHGLPNQSAASAAKYTGHDWTDGCIAVTSTEIEEIWDLVKNGTAILILP